MGEPRDLQNQEFLRLSSQLGDLLLSLFTNDCPASKEFQYMGHEFKAFHASYQIIRPYVQQPSYFLSEPGVDLVRKIYDGVETICEHILDDLEPFRQRLERAQREHERRVSSFFVLHGGRSTARDRNRRVLKFLGRHDYALERCQLRYGNMLLNLMLAVFVYAQCIHSAAEEAAFVDTSSYLITDLYTALTELRSKERREKRARRTDRLPVETSWWWEPPNFFPHADPPAPLAILMRIWVNPEARMAVRPSPDMQGLQDTIRQWKEHSQEQTRNLRELDAGNHQLREANQQLTYNHTRLQRNNEELQTNIGTLQDTVNTLRREVARYANELRTERDALHRHEQETEFHRERHDAIHHRYAALLEETERAERHARAGRPYDDIPQTSRNVSRERSHHRDPTAQTVPQELRRQRTCPRRQEGPPVSYETQGQSRRRRSSSSSSRSNRSSGGWSRTSTAVETSSIRPRRTSSPKAPPIPVRTRPFRTGF